MLTTQTTAGNSLLKRVVQLASLEADILFWFAQRRPAVQRDGEIPGNGEPLSPEHLAHRAKEIAEALICCAGGPRAAGSASRIWSRVRAMLMNYTLGQTAEEFIIYHVTKNQYESFPYGLAASDLVRLATGEFSASRIRSAMMRMARQDLIRRCYTKRRRRHPNNPIPIAEYVWFYAGPSSKYAESPDLVLYMHTPWEERPSDPASAA